jgi:hypothetical protein
MVLPHSPFSTAVEIARSILSPNLPGTFSDSTVSVPPTVPVLTIGALCNCVVAHPELLLSQTQACRMAVLGPVIAYEGLYRNPSSSLTSRTLEGLEIHRLASAALAGYVKAGLQAGGFAPKLQELLDMGLDPFFEWRELGVSTNLLDAVIHHSASDCALLLAQRGVGHGYLSNPLPTVAFFPRSVFPPPTRLGNQGGTPIPLFVQLQNSASLSGRSIAHTLVEAGSLREISLAANCGLNFSHSASNIPHPLVFAVLKLRVDAVHYLVSNEESLRTVAGMAEHKTSMAVLENAERLGSHLAGFVHDHARKAYPHLFLN